MWNFPFGSLKTDGSCTCAVRTHPGGGRNGASRAEGALASAAAQAARSAAAAKVCGFVVIASIIPKNAAFLPPVNFPKFALENRGEFSL
jgi:hypothetical protein